MTCKSNGLSLGLLVSLALIAASGPAAASPITGTLNLSGTFTIGANFLNFCATAGPCPAASGNWNVPSIGTIDLLTPYADDPNGGLITNLTSVSEPVGTVLPGNGVLFLTFAPSGALPTPDIQFYVTEVFAGVGSSASCGAAPAPGQVCTPTGSSVTLVNGAGGDSSATVTMQGLARRISTNEFDSLQNGLHLPIQYAVPKRAQYVRVQRNSHQHLLGVIYRGRRSRTGDLDFDGLRSVGVRPAASPQTRCSLTPAVRKRHRTATACGAAAEIC